MHLTLNSRRRPGTTSPRMTGRTRAVGLIAAVTVALGTTAACASDGAADGGPDDFTTSSPSQTATSANSGTEVSSDGAPSDDTSANNPTAPENTPGADPAEGTEEETEAGANDGTEEETDDPAGTTAAAWAGLGGTANPTLPDSGEDFVALSGAYHQIATTPNWNVAVVAKNNTDQTVYSMTATATATDAAGAEVKKSMPFELQPLAVEPGGLAIGTIMITSKELDGTETIDLTIEASADADDDDVDLQPTDVRDDGGTIVSAVTNTSAGSVTGPLMLQLGCFTEDGEIIGIVDEVALDAEDVAAGGSTDVEVSPGFYIKECPTFLMAASGRAGA